MVILTRTYNYYWRKPLVAHWSYSKKLLCVRSVRKWACGFSGESCKSCEKLALIALVRWDFDFSIVSTNYCAEIRSKHFDVFVPGNMFPTTHTLRCSELLCLLWIPITVKTTPPLTIRQNMDCLDFPSSSFHVRSLLSPSENFWHAPVSDSGPNLPGRLSGGLRWQQFLNEEQLHLYRTLSILENLLK